MRKGPEEVQRHERTLGSIKRNDKGKKKERFSQKGQDREGKAGEIRGGAQRDSRKE